MIKIMKKIGMLLAAFVLIVSCDDFEEINVNPTAASADQVQVEYFINGSIIGAQQDPHIAERVFVLYWSDASRMDNKRVLSEGGYNAGWTADYYRYVGGWLNDINSAIEVADTHLESGNIKEYTSNLKQVSRIWRAYLMSEMADNFGPIAIEGFQGENPDYNSVEDVYMFLLAELKEATAMLDVNVSVPNGVANLDAAYGFDFTKWKAYGTSMRMRLAMRLSEVAPGVAQQEFEDAVNNNAYVSVSSENFKVKEGGGWNSLTNVMSRQWNNHYLSASLNNLAIGLGGINSADQLDADKHAFIKPGDHMGLKFDDHFTTLTNDPSAGFWFDGLHEKIDPRIYALYKIPGDVNDPDFNKYPTWSSSWGDTVRPLLDDNGDEILTVDATNHWNAPSSGDWGEKGAKNRLRYIGTLPRLSHKYRSDQSDRLFFASWESYFLIAEAAVRGWSVPYSAKAAYEQGISESFEYNGVSQHYGNYVLSQDYNRVGTSVSFDHLTEPPATMTMNYVDGYTNTPGTHTFTYPSNTIYEGGSVKNDQLTKIITQKYIAQNPYLALEGWNDHRRLGLPFFENPAIENPLANLPDLTTSNYMTNSVKFNGQRQIYPANFADNVPDGYEQAVGHLGGPDEILTPLWWAKKN